MFLSKAEGPIGHHQVMQGFPQMKGTTPRSDLQILFRNDGKFTLIQSKIRPTLPGLEVKEFTIAPIHGQSYHFLTSINSVFRQSRTGRQFSMLPEDWFKARNFGAEFSIGLAVRQFKQEESKGRKIPLDQWTIGGTLLVTDSNCLSRAITDGIGRGKAWGCGLLSLAKI